MSAQAGPTLQDVTMLAQEVWSSFLGDREPLLEGTPVDQSGPLVSAAVGVSGAWNGTISLQVPDTLAHTITASMLGDVHDTCESDVSDAVGELVNVVGGNIKSLMPGPSALSLPVVAQGRIVWPHECVEVVGADLTWAGQPVRIAVHIPVDPSTETEGRRLR